MPADKDVMGKADALLRRHSLGAPGTATDTQGVPVLTEIIEPRPVQDDATAALAREVFDRVMADVEGRLAADLERRLAQHLSAQMHSAVASALGDLHQELANTIGDAIRDALAKRHLK
jgi:hypothetical protein